LVLNTVPTAALKPASVGVRRTGLDLGILSDPMGRQLADVSTAAGPSSIGRCCQGRRTTIGHVSELHTKRVWVAYTDFCFPLALSNVLAGGWPRKGHIDV